MYSKFVEEFDIPTIWFAVPEVPKPVPPLDIVSGLTNVKDEANNEPVIVAEPATLNPVPPDILPLTPSPPDTIKAPVVEDVELVLS